MLIGYNTNIKYRGKVYHVQTEDSGPANPQIVTLLYHQGAILSSKKTNYAHLMGRPDFEERLRELMKQQHRDMIMELKKIEGEKVGEDSGGDKEGLTGNIEKNRSIVIEEPTEDKGFGIRDKDQDIQDSEPQSPKAESRAIKLEVDQKNQRISGVPGASLDDILIDFITRRGRR